MLVIAGAVAGLVGSVAGLASVISYPALLAAGLGPVSANVTNTVALVLSGVGSALGSRPELRGQRERIARLGAAMVAGSVVGAVLLLVTPPETFARIVPWLIGAGSVAMLLRPSAERLEVLRRRGDSRGLVVAVLVIAVYAGYFGAAAGVILLALLLARTGESLPRSNAAKNVLLAIANAVAALWFAVAGPVSWLAALPLGAGFLVGARVGPVVVRHAPAGPLRLGIALAGVGVAVALGVEAYR